MRMIICIILLSMAAFLPSTVTAELSIRGGRGSDCTVAAGRVSRRWIDVKDVMLPATVKIKRPNQEDFVCVSPYYIRNAMERRTSIGVEVRCFADPDGRGLGICCDKQLGGCARLNPALVPEAANRTRKKNDRKAGYQRPDSSWVRPPNDNDQWKSP